MLSQSMKPEKELAMECLRSTFETWVSLASQHNSDVFVALANLKTGVEEYMQEPKCVFAELVAKNPSGAVLTSESLPQKIWTSDDVADQEDTLFEITCVPFSAKRHEGIGYRALHITQLESTWAEAKGNRRSRKRRNQKNIGKSCE